MKKFIFLTLIIFFAFTSYAQQDSLQQQIMNYADTNAQFIAKGRGLLTEKFKEGDYEKVKEIKDYLLQNIHNENYIIFYPMEYWYILYWTQEYNELLTSFSQTDLQNNIFFKEKGNHYHNDLLISKKIPPPEDLLISKLYQRSKDSILVLDSFIENSSLGQEYKDILKLRLQYLTSRRNPTATTQDSLNSSATKFLKSYPQSSFAPFVQRYIRYEFVHSKWGFTFEFFSGYGVLNKELESYFTNPVPIGIDFDIYYQKVALFLRDYIGFSKTKLDIPYTNGTWKKGSQVRVFLPEASLGYVALDNKIFKVTPFAGISGTDFSPTEYDIQNDHNLRKAEIEFTTTYTAGLNVDIKMGKTNSNMVSFREESYWFLRIRYGYNWPQFKNKYNRFDGTMQYITIGVGGFGRAIKRKY